MISSTQRGAHNCSKSATESSHPDESNLFFFLPNFLCAAKLSHILFTVPLCGFSFFFISPYLIQFIIQGPFVPLLSGHTKRSTQDGAFFTFCPLLPWDAGSAKNTWSRVFLFVYTKRGKPVRHPAEG